MSLYDFLLISLFYVNFVNCKFYKNNITDEELRTCTTYYCRSGSVYKDFFEIKNKPADNDTLLLDFHFSVLAASDAHILLASSEEVDKNDPVYEIVIGAGGNTFCDIRRQQKALVKQSIRRKDLLSAVDVKTFWLHVSKDGVIDVGTEGEELPFISWTDPDPLPLRVFSFSTWSGIAAKWYFDCERDEDKTKHFELIKRNLTDLEKLRKELLYHYNPYVRPVLNESTFSHVNMSIHTYDISLNVKKALVTLRGESRLAWFDEKLRWEPEKYGNLKLIHIFRHEIWQPDLVLYNGYGSTRDILEDSMMVVHSNGLVQWNTSMNFKAWCDGTSKENWPSDIHNCNFLIGFFSDFDKMTLNFNENLSSIGHPIGSEWEILSVSILTSPGWLDEDPFDPPILQLSMSLQRSSGLYNTIFFTPYIIVAISVMATFWISPFGPLKISLGCVQLLICSIMLIGLDTTLPSYSQTFPYLIYLYGHALMATFLSIIISIIVINISRNRQKGSLPRFLVRLLTSAPIKVSLCLCMPKDNNGIDEYDKLSESSFKKSDDNNQVFWILLGVTIDRISFFIYFGLFIYSLVVYY